jgi:hypothetical protein
VTAVATSEAHIHTPTLELGWEELSVLIHRNRLRNLPEHQRAHAPALYGELPFPLARSGGQCRLA